MGEIPKFERPSNDKEDLDLTLERSNYLLEHIAKQDEMLKIEPLTQLKNRETFLRELEQALRMVRREVEERRSGPHNGISLIYIDLDRFKEVNDTFGHPAGDEVLQKIAALLMESVRATDTVARLGGEELAVLMHGADTQTAAQHAEELRANIEQMTFDADPRLKVTASFGIVSSKDSTDAKELYDLGDKALYKAKENGRNRVEIYESVPATDQ